MNRFAATTLDLSSLPPPEVVKDLNYEAILAARLESLATRMQAGGIDWNVGALLTDPLAFVEREDAFRELLGLAAINDAAKSVMPAFATGADLEQLAAGFGIRRRQIRAATSEAAAVFESDRELRRRLQIAPEAFTTAGSAAAYEHHAKEACAEVVDVAIVVPELGRVDVILLSRDTDGGPSTDGRLAVRERLLRKDVKPTTAEVTVRGATALAFEVELTLFVRRGPDPSLVRASAIAAMRKLLADRRAIGATIPTSAVIAAAHVAGVERVELVRPAADVTPAADQVASCGALKIDWELSDE